MLEFRVAVSFGPTQNCEVRDFAGFEVLYIYIYLVGLSRMNNVMPQCPKFEHAHKEGRQGFWKEERTTFWCEVQRVRPN